MFLCMAINHTQLGFFNYNSYWTADENRLYNMQFIVMSWFAFSFMFLTLMSLLLKMFVDIYMLYLRTQLITALVALNIVGVCLFVDYKCKEKIDIQ